MNSKSFEERIDASQSASNLLVEHLIRYELVAQMTACSSCTYFDLGCGTGFGLKVLQSQVPNSVLYGFDIADEALARAASYLGKGSSLRLLRIDLTRSESYGAIENFVKVHQESRRVLICFEAVEHLDDFRSLIAFVNRQVQNGAEAFLSVPNDAFWGVHNPFHKNMFGEESLPELMQLFDNPPKLHKHYPMQGATILPDAVRELTEDQIAGKLLPQFLDRSQCVSVPSHFILHGGSSESITNAFTARFTLWDAAAERQWIAQRESDMLYYREEARRLGRRWKLFQRIIRGLNLHLSEEKAHRLNRGFGMLRKLSDKTF